jgi:Domain of unknown function (DUF4173)
MRGNRLTFLRKLGAAALVVIAADRIFYVSDAQGVWLGVLALALLVVLIVTRPAVRHDRAARIALGVTALAALVLIDDPSPLAFLWVAIAGSLAALFPRRRFDDALRWAGRLAIHFAGAVPGPILDARRLFNAPRRGTKRFDPLAVARLLILPVAGSLVFIALFAAANPLIEEGLAQFSLPGLNPGRTMFCALMIIVVWHPLRPRALATRFDLSDSGTPLANSDPCTIILSLTAFNLIFAVQNGLDLAFLWSGASLPEGVSLADYAHRGAYPLIATALLAGLFVVVFLRPGSAAATSVKVRWLVTLWVVQNILLVSSSILRTLDYVDAYSLTVLRIAALAWMGLVALGLALICFRLLRDRSAAWLINANAAAAAGVLAIAALIDLGAVAAQWNVRHARQAGGPGAPIDLCYLVSLGDSALLPLIEFEQRSLPEPLTERVKEARGAQLASLREAQSDWRTWTPRGARRLSAADTLLGPRAFKASSPPRGCD